MDLKPGIAQSLAIGRAALGGDSGSLAEEVTGVFDELHEPVYRYLLLFLASVSDAEDLTQETFLRLYTELRAQRDIRNIRSWLFRVAHNLAVDRKRQQSGTERWMHVALERAHEQIPQSVASAEQALLETERERRLETALAWLSPQQRQCLELRAQGLRYREISEVLGIHISTVRTCIARAVAKIAGES